MSGSGHIRSTLKHASVYSFASVLGKAVGFIMLPIYANYLRGEGYGIIGMIDTVLSVMTLLVGYGITGAMSRFYYEKTDETERRTVVSTVIILMFFVVILVASPVYFLSSPVAWLVFGSSEYAPYIQLAVLAFMAEMTSKNAQAYLVINQKSVFFSVLSLLRLIVSFSLNILFIVKLEMGVYGYLYSSLIVAILFTIFMHAYALWHVGLRFDRTIARNVFGFSLPLMPGYIAMFIRGNADRYLLRVYLGLVQVGVFEMLFKFATLIGLLIGEPFMRTWAMKQLEICDTEEGPATMAQVFTLHLFLMLLAGLVLALEIPILLRILTPPEFWVGGTLALMAVVTRIILSCYYHFYFGLVYTKSTMQISGIQGSTAVVSVTSNLLLIPRLGLLGALTSSLLASTFQCLLALRIARRHYLIRYQWRKVGFLALLFFALYFLIAPMNLASMGLLPLFNSHIFPLVGDFLRFIQLDALQNGKYLLKILENLELCAEGGIKLVLSLLFVIGAIAAGIVPVRMPQRGFWLFRQVLRTMGKSG
ncbi:MAG: lipopolysaccharide biosynthesis protein [Desulfuromonadales bacterium]|nr:lipopolysaccharide biosynthesis protein [Desulfuromonadales bacterium]